MVEHEWCTLYVETTLSSRELGFVLAQAVGGAVDAEAFGTEIRGEGVDISVRKNDDADVTRATEFPDGFIFFSWRVEVEIRDRLAAARVVSQALQALWAKGVPAIAAGNLDDAITDSGGYRNTSVPWPAVR